MSSYVFSWFQSAGDDDKQAQPKIIVKDEDADKTPRVSIERSSTSAHDDLTMFPARDSIQRAAAPSKQVAALPSSAFLSPGSGGPPASPDRDSSDAPRKKKHKHHKERLAPGHSQLDWARLTRSGVDLRGTDTLLRVSPSELARHNTREDAWAVFFGKVYNITPYLSYHPGGERRLMKAAGRDGTKLFLHSHEWVNIEALMSECFVGFLVAEPHD